MRITFHAQQRIQQRMAGITTVAEVMDACISIPDHEAYVVVEVKSLPKFTVVDLGGESYSQMSKGDMVVAICRYGHITTIMLRKSWSKSNAY